MLKRGRSLQQDQEAEANKGAALHARGHHAGALAAGHGVTAGACSSSSPSCLRASPVQGLRRGSPPAYPIRVSGQLVANGVVNTAESKKKWSRHGNSR